MRKKTINIVKDSGGFLVRTSLNGNRFELKAANKTGRYNSPDSAKRAWRKFASENMVDNYTYSVQG